MPILAPRCLLGRREARKHFFLKKEAKTFANRAYAGSTIAASVAKVFWVFFSKKNRLLSPEEVVLPLRSPTLLAAFRIVLHWYFWRGFSAVRLSRSGIPERYAGQPIVVYTNHPSWWDPALVMLISPKLFPGRLGFGPMDEASLNRYGLFRRMGLFGVDPTPRGAARFLRTARALLANPAAIMWITAEGQFSDPRIRPIVLRPGVAHLARDVPHAIFMPAALEYSFWNESRPEALVRFGLPIERGDDSVAAWNARLEAALAETMDLLAAESMTRDPSLFTRVMNGTAGVGGIYDVFRSTRAALGGPRFQARHMPEREQPGGVE